MHGEVTRRQQPRGIGAISSATSLARRGAGDVGGGVAAIWERMTIDE